MRFRTQVGVADTQNLANTNVPTTPPLRDGYGTIGICQGCHSSGGGSVIGSEDLSI